MNKKFIEAYIQAIDLKEGFFDKKNQYNIDAFDINFGGKESSLMKIIKDDLRSSGITSLKQAQKEIAEAEAESKADVQQISVENPDVVNQSFDSEKSAIISQEPTVAEENKTEQVDVSEKKYTVDFFNNLKDGLKNYFIANNEPQNANFIEQAFTAALDGSIQLKDTEDVSDKLSEAWHPIQNIKNQAANAIKTITTGAANFVNQQAFNTEKLNVIDQLKNAKNYDEFVKIINNSKLKTVGNSQQSQNNNNNQNSNSQNNTNKADNEQQNSNENTQSTKEQNQQNSNNQQTEKNDQNQNNSDEQLKKLFASAGLKDLDVNQFKQIYNQISNNPELAQYLK